MANFVKLLSSGFFQTINADALAQNPPVGVVQIASLKQIKIENGVRNRVILSDGIHLQQGVLSSQLGHLVDENKLKKFSIIKIQKYNVNNVHNVNVLMVLDLEIIASNVEEKIGDPVPLTTETIKQDNPFKTPEKSPQSIKKPKLSPIESLTIPQQITPIIELKPYSSLWKIQVRVTRKGQIKRWSNFRGDGKLFTLGLIDETGEIEAIAFDDAADKFYPIFQVGKVYFISGGSVKVSNRTYKSMNNEYQLSLGTLTYVKPLDETQSTLPFVSYNFVPIDELPFHTDSVVDVVGIITHISNLATIKTKDHDQVPKLDITIFDESKTSIMLTLWRDEAERISKEYLESNLDPQIITIKGAKVSNFSACSLSSINNSFIELNPTNLPEATNLISWYTNIGINSDLVSLTTNFRRNIEDEPRMTIEQIMIEESDLQLNETRYFTLKATICFVARQNIYYQACPETGVKVVQDENGFFSPKKQQYYETCNYQYCFKIKVKDLTGSIFLHVFNEVGEIILNQSASSIASLETNGDDDEVTSILDDALYQTYFFLVRAQVREYVTGTFQYSAVSCKKITPSSDSQDLLQVISQSPNNPILNTL